MPILDLQRRLAEVGRIRLGEQVTTRSGKKAPAKLTRFRFTSPSAELIDQAAALYGGTPNDWTAPSGPQREVVTEATSIPVLIPPGDMAFSQWYEMWSGGGCQKRCDGRFDIQRDRTCDCDPDARECKPTTRVSMVLPEMPGVGLWRVETHGHYAAVELGATVELLQSLAPGRLVPGRLRLDPRTVKRVGSDGKPQTRNFVVPVLDIEGTMAALGQRETPVAIDPAPPAGLTPVPAAVLDAAPQPSIAAQLEQTKATPRRSNAAAVIPPTGIKPGKPTPPAVTPWKAVDPDTWDRWRKRCMAKSAKVLDPEPDRTAQRHGLAWQASVKLRGAGIESWNDVTETEAAAIEDGLEALKAGAAVWTFDPDGRWMLVRSPAGHSASPAVSGGVSEPGGETEADGSPPVAVPQSTASTVAPSGLPPDTDTLDLLRQAIAKTPRMTEGKALKRARELAQELGLQHLPTDFDSLPRFPQVLASLAAELVEAP